MATASRERAAPTASRIERRRAAVREEALRHAEDVMAAAGVGALTVSEVARRMGIRGPSLYKYFPSRNALFDALFARGLADQQAATRAAVEGTPRGVPRIRAVALSIAAWAVAHPALAQLLFWRPVPGFEPSPETFAASVQDMADARAEFAEAVRLGQLRPEADSDDVLRLYTATVAGIVSQQLANQPGVPFADGVFTRLTDRALDVFLSAYAP